jgi:adenine-specific DNA-methyltransferase
MDKMRMESIDMTAQNIEKIGALFPNCITEIKDADGKPKKAINFDLLRQMLSGDVLEGDEAYEFTWVGKKSAIVEANKPIRKTLRPCKEESVNWDSTENLYIEGDNLEVLKLLQESYLGKVKMIYIDPPYNTGNDFIYRDDFKQSAADYDEESGVYDEDGNRMFKNTDTNGRFHSDWCSMIYSRLMLARNLLADDGVIFISIDDHESDNLKKICDEVYGVDCFVANISWQRTYSIRNDSKGIPTEVEHLLTYSKLPAWEPNKLPRTEKMNAAYSNPDGDISDWMSGSPVASDAATHQGMVYAIQHPFTGELFYPSDTAHWRYSQEQMLEYLNGWCQYTLKDIGDEKERARVCGIAEKDIRKDVKAIVLAEPFDIAKRKAEEVYKKGPWPRFYFTNGGMGGMRRKVYLDSVGGRIATNYWCYDEVGHTDEAKKEIKNLFDGNAPFDTPKPTRLIERILELSTESDCIVLDFFSGSATTAHAVLKKNAEDHIKRKFIMIQVPEKTSSDKFLSICEIGKERIRRAGKKMLAELAEKDNSTLHSPNSTLDIGFRVLKLDDTNMKDVYYAPADYEQNVLDLLESNIKEDRTDLDLLFGCLLEWGLPLSLPYQSEDIDGCTVHNYNDGDLIACFDENIPDSVIKTIAKRQPLRAVFRDSSFASSPSKINVTQIFKELAPDTSVKVL